MKRFALAGILLFPFTMLAFWVYWGTTLRHDMAADATKKTTAERLEQYGPAARTRLQPFFTAQKVAYPPARAVFVGLKQEKLLEVYAANSNQPPVFIRSYPVLAASGKPGPKLAEGDGQVPEGVYPIEFLNPNSQYHLSLRVGYPNQFDLDRAHEEHREDLGGDIMIHGGAASVGCLAVGDEAAEDLFVLAADTGIQNVTVVIAPVDFRNPAAQTTFLTNLPDWTPNLYQIIKSNLNALPRAK